MRLIVILIPLLLSACASPSPQYFGAVRHDITLQDIRFAVFQQESSAQVVRLGYLSRRQRALVPGLMVEAAEKTTGCTAIPNSLRSRIPGDTGEGRISLQCY